MPRGEAHRSDAKGAWRLEAHDLRGGLSFAIYRDAEGFHEGPGDAPVYFIAAPSFAPEPVASATVALAATRGGFAHGLFLPGAGREPVEAAFESLSAVAEFARRAYVASAGGDGPEGNEPPSPPLPEPPGEPPREPMREAPRVREGSRERAMADEAVHRDRAALLGRLAAQQKQIDQAGQGQSFLVERQGLGRIASSEGLARAYLQILRELRQRRPPTGDLQLARWLEQLQRLDLCADVLGLWPALNEPSVWTQWDELLIDLDPYVPLDWWAPRPLYFSLMGFVDGFDLIGALPLPRVAQPLLPDTDRADARLVHLLVRFVSSPHAVLDLDGEAREAALDLICFAAACVVAPARLRRTLWNGAPHKARTMSPVQAEQLTRLVDDAMAWLEEHLPARLYERQLEERINASRRQRYQRAT